MEKTELLEVIKAKVADKWKADGNPLLTSFIGTQLSRDGINYREILEGGNLTEFIRVNHDAFKIVKHPTQTAKIGVIPSSENYSFAYFENSDGISPPSGSDYMIGDETRLRRTRGAFYAFVRAVSELKHEEIASINIPMPVIVRLLEGK